jgi:hypothetical protein
MMNLAALSAAIFAGSLSIEAPGVSVGQPAGRPSPAFSNDGAPSTSLGASLHAPRVVIGDVIRNEDAYGGDGSFLLEFWLCRRPTPLIIYLSSSRHDTRSAGGWSLYIYMYIYTLIRISHVP